MKRLFLAGCVSGAMLLGVAVVPAGAATVHAVSPSVAAKLKHVRVGHKLTAAQLRRDKAAAGRLLKSLRSHKAHAAAFLYAGSFYSNALNPVTLTEATGLNSGLNGAVPSRYFSPPAGTNTSGNCFLTTAFTFTSANTGSCIFLRNDLYQDTSNGNVYGFQLLCPDYGPGQAKDNNVLGPITGTQLGCDYADTYWFAVSSSFVTNTYGLFQYEP